MSSQLSSEPVVSTLASLVEEILSNLCDCVYSSTTQVSPNKTQKQNTIQNTMGTKDFFNNNNNSKVDGLLVDPPGCWWSICYQISQFFSQISEKKALTLRPDTNNGNNNNSNNNNNNNNSNSTNYSTSFNDSSEIFETNSTQVMNQHSVNNNNNNNNRLYLETEGSSKPHPEKESTGGEDAYFICEHGLGVADGVGGWRDYGIDPAAFSRQLMQSASEYITNRSSCSCSCSCSCSSSSSSLSSSPSSPSPSTPSSPSSSSSLSSSSSCCSQPCSCDCGIGMDDRYASIPLPLQAMYHSYQQVTVHSPLSGSSTACILHFDPNTNILSSANLGDSGYLIFRNNHLLYKSETQQHYFNCPFQLGLLSKDQPTDCSIAQILLQEGDIIVTATDGLFDNLFDSQIMSILHNMLMWKKKHRQVLKPKEVADVLVEEAYKTSLNPYCMTPFSQGAHQAQQQHRGGKLDDITVLVSIVRRV